MKWGLFHLHVIQLSYRCFGRHSSNVGCCGICRRCHCFLFSRMLSRSLCLLSRIYFRGVHCRDFCSRGFSTRGLEGGSTHVTVFVCCCYCASLFPRETSNKLSLIKSKTTLKKIYHISISQTLRVIHNFTSNFIDFPKNLETVGATFAYKCV